MTRRISVLIVDDHALARHAFRRLLDDDPVLTVVGEAGHGDVAVRLARRLKPRVVVMDCAMPGAGGLTATQRILELRPDDAILMLSMLFGTFAEEQWKTLVLPTLKLSTQHGYKRCSRNTCCPTGATGACGTAIEALEHELFPSVPKLPDGRKPANSASRDFRVA